MIIYLINFNKNLSCSSETTGYPPRQCESKLRKEKLRHTKQESTQRRQGRLKEPSRMMVKEDPRIKSMPGTRRAARPKRGSEL